MKNGKCELRMAVTQLPSCPTLPLPGDSELRLLHSVTVCRRAELFAPESRVSSLGRGPAAPAQFEGLALIIAMHLLLPAVEVSPLPFLTTVPSAMFFLFLAYSSYLHFIGPSRAQVSAPNCTDSTYLWVGTLCADARFVSITACLSHCAGVFTHSRSIRSNKAPVWWQRTWEDYATTAVSTCTL